MEGAVGRTGEVRVAHQLVLAGRGFEVAPALVEHLELAAVGAPRQAEALALAVVVEVGEQVAGIGLFAPKRGGSAKLSPFLVAPEFQSRGIGSALIESIESHAEELDVRRLYHHFPSCSIMTQLFFTKHGYLPEARIREPYSPGVDEIIVSKFLIHVGIKGKSNMAMMNGESDVRKVS